MDLVWSSLKPKCQTIYECLFLYVMYVVITHILFQGVPFLSEALKDDNPLSVVCDTISVCSHLVRTSPEHLGLVKAVFKGNKG